MRRHLSCCLLALCATSAARPALEDDGGGPAAAGSLREKFGPRFAVGVALGGRVPDDYTEAERRLILGQFGSVTPENAMKMAMIQPREGEFRFEEADALVAFAQEHGLHVVGHTLLWARDENTPEWVFRDGDRPASREVVLGRLREHIRTVVTRYRGKVAAWDVVNEAIDDGEADLRPSKWLEIVGPDFLAEAFAAAREADPDALLIYNDFNIEQPAKRAKLLRMLADLLAKGVPIDAVGIQGHWEVDRVPLGDLETLLAEAEGLGLKVIVSELDLGVVPRGRWWADDGKHREEMARTDPLADGAPAELLERQARQYAELFRLLSDHAETIDRVTFWNLHDGRSWLNRFPWRRTEHPLLFDRDAAPKPAFRAVLGVD